MAYIFRNKGVMDPRSISTFGVSSKEGKNPIGFFGTGLKYAIAVLLRNKCDIVIHSGDSMFKFHTVRSKLRASEFDFVYMNDEPLGFTTELGKTWEIWQAFRELACNTIDEDGEYFEYDCASDDYITGETVIVVTGEAFAAPWAERKQIILESEILFKDDSVEIRDGQSRWLYYRGVRVSKLERPSKFTYNITTKCELTEDRSFKNSYMPGIWIETAIKWCDNSDIVRTVVTASDQYYESGIFYSGSAQKVFKEVVTDLLRRMVQGVNKSAIDITKAGNLKAFITNDTHKLDDIDRMRFETAVAFCTKIGFPVSEYEIVVSSNLGVDVMGRAIDDTIYVSAIAFRQGTKMVAGTLIEEYIHLKHGVRDQTLSMQNLLIDTICSLGERITKKPL